MDSEEECSAAGGCYNCTQLYPREEKSKTTSTQIYLGKAMANSKKWTWRNLVPTAICLSWGTSGETYGRGDEVELGVYDTLLQEV